MRGHVHKYLHVFSISVGGIHELEMAKHIDLIDNLDWGFDNRINIARALS